MKNLILTIFILSFISCTNSELKKTNPNKTSKHIKIKVLKNKEKQVLTKTNLQSENNQIPEIYLFKHSECGGNCGDTKQIIYENKKARQLFLKFGTVKNCIGKFKHEINVENDVLIIKIGVKGNVSLDCECFFNFEIGIKNVNHSFKYILVNGEKIINGQLMKNPFVIKNESDTIIK